MDAELIRKLADLPWQLQLVASSGYCAYLLAYRGIRQNHKAADVLFLGLAFGLIAWAILSISSSLIVSAQITFVFLGTLTGAVLWRKFFRGWIEIIFRKTSYSWSDDSQSAWERMLQEQFTPTQITVELKNGRYLYCTDTSIVGNLPFGPYVLGADGDVIMYVDQSEVPGEPSETHIPIDATWGNLLTYIPKDEIRKIAIRNLRNPSRPSAEVAA